MYCGQESCQEDREEGFDQEEGCQEGQEVSPLGRCPACFRSRPQRERAVRLSKAGRLYAFLYDASVPTTSRSIFWHRRWKVAIMGPVSRFPPRIPSA
jgi:hypothetical protein